MTIRPPEPQCRARRRCERTATGPGTALRRRHCLRWAGALFVLVLAFACSPPATGAAPAPTVHASDAGAQMQVRLAGWPAGARVSVTTCGNSAARGSADCAVAAGVLLVTGADGSASGRLSWTAPPVRCPCVVRAVAVALEGPEQLAAATPAPARIVAAAPTTAPAARPTESTAPDAATVYAHTPAEPLVTPTRYVTLVSVLGGLLVIGLGCWMFRRARRRPAAPRWELLLLRAPAFGCALAAVGVLATFGYDSVSASASTALAQRRLTGQLAATWDGAGGQPVGHSQVAPEAIPADGEAFALLRVPRFGADYQVAIVQGVSAADLAKGPGHYRSSAAPGAVGNFAVAGHRGPPGEPFNDINRLVTGDKLIVETARSRFIYRVTGHAIVRPTQVDVVAPVPRRPGAEPDKAVMTLTACHPRWSGTQRWVTWATLTQSVPKADAQAVRS